LNVRRDLFEERRLRSSEGNVFVGDFRACAGTAGKGIFGGSAVIEVIASTAARASACAGACGHAIAASTEHTEITGDNFEAGALLAFFILPFAGLDASFDENEGAFF
jgi:hypothetical protein